MSSGILFPSLDTPAILVDLDKLDANLKTMARMASDAGLKLRPNMKVHRSTYVADLQIKAGAIGICVSKPNEALAFAEAGFNDIMIAHPFFGEHKLAALRCLISRVRISCVVDSITASNAIAEVGRSAGIDVPVLLKIDTGLSRFGALPGVQALEMARNVAGISGIELVGILTHESAWDKAKPEDVEKLAFQTASTMSEVARTLNEHGIAVRDVVLGATPTARALCGYASEFPELTEIHPGAYAFGDCLYVSQFSMTESECAATVLTTVISTPSPGRICVDGGYKTFGADPILAMATRSGGLGEWSPTFGTVRGRPDLTVGRLTEEIGILTAIDSGHGVEIGDRLEILPNRVSLTVNLHDRMYGVRNGVIETEISITCRGFDR